MPAAHSVNISQYCSVDPNSIGIATLRMVTSPNRALRGCVKSPEITLFGSVFFVSPWFVNDLDLGFGFWDLLKPMIAREDDRLRARPYPELVEDVRRVIANGLIADRQTLRNLRVGEPLGHQRQNLSLAR